MKVGPFPFLKFKLMFANKKANPPMRALRLLPATLCLLPIFLMGCESLGLKETPTPKLAGERIDVTIQPTLLKVNPAAGKVAFALPLPEALPNWAQSGANSSHTPGHVALPATVKRAWSANIGGGFARGKALLNPPVVHSGRLFFSNTKGEVTALNAQTGKELWQISLPLAGESAANLAGGMAVSGNLVFITTGSGQVFALTADKGEQVWETPLNVPLRAAPTTAGESVYVLSHDNRLFALSALNGALQWTHSGIEEVLAPMKAASVAVVNGAIVVPYTSGEIYVLRAADGRYLWHETLTSPFSGQDPATTMAAIAAPPVVADGIIYAVGLNGGLSAYGLVDGQRYWRTDLTSSQLPIVAGAHIFVLTDKGELVALNRQDGLVRWVSNLNAGLPEAGDGKRLWVGPLLAGGRLIVASNDGYAVSVNPQSGAKLAATEIDEGVSVPPIVAGGMLYFLTDAGRLIAFGGK